MNWFHRYVIRGIDPVFVFAMLTVLWTGCTAATNQSQEQKAREEGKRILDAMDKDASGEIRKYTEGQMQPGKPVRKEKGR